MLNARIFAELRSYVEPPPVVNLITKALLAVFDPEKSSDEWNNYKSVCSIKKTCVRLVLSFLPLQSLSLDLVKKMKEYDPLHATDPGSCFSRLSVLQHGSLPALHLYNWLSVTLSLLEHASKMASNL